MSQARLSFIPVAGIPEVEPGMDLAAVIAHAMGIAGLEPMDGDIIAVAQKVVSKAENRFVDLSDIEPSPAALALTYARGKDPRMAEMVLRESVRVVRDTEMVLIVEHRSGIVLANAGIDRSNVRGDQDTVLLLPEDADASAAGLRQALETLSGKRLGVLITDSVGRPWRNGTTGVAIGCAGIAAMDDRRGEHDRSGRELLVAEVATADSLAAAACLVMGEGAEGLPIVLVRGAGAGDSGQTARDILRPAAEDLFR